MLNQTTQTDLTYNIVEELLTGAIDGTSISAHGVSGGRAGSKTRGAVSPALANNPFATRVKLTKQNPGGPIVLGMYRLRTHETRASWIRLLPFRENSMGDRAGFAIHGRGKRGSDGCIVPTDFNIVKLIHRLVRKREEAGLPAPTLAVIAMGDIRAIEKRLERLSHTA